ncbi:MAG: GWxTD domain-containing protein [Bacteroidia bacterium]
MKKLVLWLLIASGAKYAQPIWIERPKGAQEHPLFRVQVYHIGWSDWVLFLQVEAEPWLPYSFDTTLTVRLQVFTEKELAAETLVTLPAISHWEGFLRGRFPELLSGQMTAICISATDAPHEAYCTQAYWPSGRTMAWIEAAEAVLRPPVRVQTLGGESWVTSPGDSLWIEIFIPAAIDTSTPLPPYVLRSRQRRSSPVLLGCAWYLKGDTTRVFWTCEAKRSFYPCPGATMSPPPPETWSEAYLRFSDQKPGERTDRGMVYLFYGAPRLRLLSPRREIWIYPEENVSFHFVWEKGSWQLVRRLEYQNLWKRK